MAEDETRKGIRKMKKGRAAMGEEGIELAYKIFFYHVYDTGESPDDFLRSVFIALPAREE